MKNIKYNLLLLGALCLASCSALLDEIPSDRLTEEHFYNSQEDALSAVYAVYQPLRHADYYGFLIQLLQEAHSDVANGRGSYAPVSEYRTLDGTNIGRTELVWRQCYQAILRANIVLDQVPGIEMDDALKAEIIAEAHFLRGLAYFDLVRNWGGVPIRRSSADPDDMARSSVEEAYTFIVADLEIAETGLPERRAVSGRATAYAAKTLLAYVYLTLEEWDSAAVKAKEVIDADVYRLVPIAASEDFEQVFGAAVTTSSEDILSLKYSSNGGQGFAYLSFIHAENAHYSPVGFRTIYAHDNYPLIGGWSDDDLRKAYNLYGEYINRNSGQLIRLPALEPYQFKKFKDEGSIAQSANSNNFPLLRYSDVLLIYAEASSEAAGGASAEAYEAVNQVRRRAYGHTPTVANSSVDLSGLSREAFREAVLEERAYEFMVEGKRWYDLRRLGRDRVREIILEAKGRNVTDAYFLWPIPQVEMNNNALINAGDQNPGY